VLAGRAPGRHPDHHRQGWGAALPDAGRPRRGVRTQAGYRSKPDVFEGYCCNTA
jgi:hypothetical protein